MIPSDLLIALSRLYDCPPTRSFVYLCNILASRVGLEPTTYGLTDRCSTYWTNETYDSNKRSGSLLQLYPPLVLLRKARSTFGLITILWSSRRESNSQLSAWKADTLAN